MTIERPTGPSYIQLELGVRPVEGGWRVFPVNTDESGPTLFHNTWDLPVMATKEQAEELGCLILWEYLDFQGRLDREKRIWAKIGALE